MLRFVLIAAMVGVPAVCCADDAPIAGSKLVERCETTYHSGKAIGFSCIDVGAKFVSGKRAELVDRVAGRQGDRQASSIRR